MLILGIVAEGIRPIPEILYYNKESLPILYIDTVPVTQWIT